MTQEVQVARPTPMKLDYGMTPGRRRNNQLFRMVVNNLGENGVIETKNLDVDLGLVYSLGPKFPDFNIDPEKAGELIAQLLHLLDQRIAKRAILVDDYGTRRKCISALLLHRSEIANSSLFGQAKNSVYNWPNWKRKIPISNTNMIRNIKEFSSRIKKSNR